MIRIKNILLLFAAISVFTANAQVKIFTLKECVQQALEKNIQLNQTQLTSQANEINLKQAKMNLLPNLNLSDAQTFDYGYSIDPFTYQSTKQNLAINNASLNSSVTLFGGFQYIYSIKQNKYIYDAGNYDVEKMKNDISLNVVAAYLQILYSYEAVDIAKKQMAATSEQVDKTQKYVDVGKLAESNLLQIQSQLASDHAAEVNAENQLQLAKVTLMQLMEMPIIDNFEVERLNDIAEPSIEAPSSTSDMYKISEGIMPEVKSSELKTNASEIGVKIAQGTLMPKLTLGGLLKSGYSSTRSLYTTTTEMNPVIGFVQDKPTEQVLGLTPLITTQKQNYPAYNQFKDNFGQAISLSLTVPIFNNFQARYATDLAKISMMNAQLNEKATKVQLRKNIEQAYTDMTAAIKNYSAAKDALKSEERTYNDMEKKYNLGLVNATDFLVEKNNFEKSSLSLVQAKYNFIFKTKIVDFYSGKSLTQ